MKEVHNLLNEGCSLELPNSQPMIAQFRVRLNLLDQIKAAQNADPEIEVVADFSGMESKMPMTAA